MEKKISLWNIHTFLISVAVVFAGLVMWPKSRESIRQLMNPPFREVLSTVSADVLKTGLPLKILKIRTDRGLFIEVYQLKGNDTQPVLYQKITLPNGKDGHFQFRGESSNLILNDVDGDGFLDILAPTFDSNLKAFLAVYRFNNVTGQFALMN